MRWLFLSLLGFFLIGCGGGYAPVYDQSLGASVKRASPVGPGEYRVRPGDTLIAIAFKLGVDYRELERINNIKDRDLIFAGQVLKTRGERVSNTQTTRAAAPARQAAKQSDQRVKTSTTTRSKTKVASLASNIKWRWPHDGRILARFSSAEGGNKGLDISGKIGDPVFAAADGVVVYAGSGLLGYGNLVIISHNQDYLSAYAHNSRILVKEKQKVKFGELVAEIGNTGASVPMLHFEVRRDGRPVDPLRYLPKR